LKAFIYSTGKIAWPATIAEKQVFVISEQWTLKGGGRQPRPWHFPVREVCGGNFSAYYTLGCLRPLMIFGMGVLAIT